MSPKNDIELPSKDKLDLMSKPELVELFQTIAGDIEKLKKKNSGATNVTVEDLAKAIQSLVSPQPEFPVDTTSKGYVVLPPIPINSMHPIQKLKWRIDNMTAKVEQGLGKPEQIAQLKNHEIPVRQKKFLEMYEGRYEWQSTKERIKCEDVIKQDIKLTKTPDPEHKMVCFHLKEYYDEHKDEILKYIAAREKENEQYNMPIRTHVYK